MLKLFNFTFNFYFVVCRGRAAEAKDKGSFTKAGFVLKLIKS